MGCNLPKCHIMNTLLHRKQADYVLYENPLPVVTSELDAGLLDTEILDAGSGTYSKSVQFFTLCKDKNANLLDQVQRRASKWMLSQRSKSYEDRPP